MMCKITYFGHSKQLFAKFFSHKLSTRLKQTVSEMPDSKIFHKKVHEKFCRFKNTSYLCNAFDKKGRLAQLVQSVCLTSRGSGVRIPQRPLTNFFLVTSQTRKGRLAQLVQSVCLTSRGSGVRIPQRPQQKPTIFRRLFYFIYRSPCYRALFISMLNSEPSGSLASIFR